LTVLVAGYGVTGRAVARYLEEAGEEVRVYIDAQGRSDVESLVKECDLVVPSPGFRPDHRVLVAAREAGVPVRSEIELAWEALRPGQTLVAITGTNGKTTVTSLVASILVASGVHAVAAGNIGTPLIEAVGSGSAVVVAEVSSFQLAFTEAFRPGVSCWLNLSPDHLDWHPDFEHYRMCKAKVWRNQGPGDSAIYNRDDPLVRHEACAIPPGVQRTSFSTTAGDFSVCDGWLRGPSGAVVAVSELPRSLPHDLSNDLAAAACALASGATLEGCRRALSRGVALPHRVALVAKAEGLCWYDDSKATTPAAVRAAVAGFTSVVLIAGGRNKGLDLSPLAACVPPVRAVVAIGEAAPEVVTVFSGLVPVREADSMRAAVEAAFALAEPGDAIVLSPGCASFDWYRSYAERGEDFAAQVEALFPGSATGGASR
jgi:UDP-N-acetylmuramoylalanine--D-glutamate ligase